MLPELIKELNRPALQLFLPGCRFTPAIAMLDRPFRQLAIQLSTRHAAMRLNAIHPTQMRLQFKRVGGNVGYLVRLTLEPGTTALSSHIRHNSVLSDVEFMSSHLHTLHGHFIGCRFSQGITEAIRTRHFVHLSLTAGYSILEPWFPHFNVFDSA